MTSKETDAMWRTRFEQPEALRLADILQHKIPSVYCLEIAAEELRRLHAANIDCVNHFNQLMDERNELLEACQTFAEWLRREEEGFVAAGKSRDTPEGEAEWREWFYGNIDLCNLAQDQARAAIAKATGEQA